MSALYHAPEDPSTKICIACETERPTDEYTVRKNGRIEARCKDCIRAADRERHNTNEHNAKRRVRAAIKREVSKLHPPVPKKAKQLSMLKVCPQCKSEKLITEYSNDKSRGVGYSPVCKECNNQSHRSEEAKSHERVRRRMQMLNPQYRTNRRAKSNKWRREHPLTQQAYTLKRLAAKRGATTEPVNFKRVLERDGYHCYICGQDINPHAVKRSRESLAFDHIVPIQPRTGEPQGTHSMDNVKPCHWVCNARKANKPVDVLTPYDRRGPQF